jgi:hypothetical protein
VSETPNIDLDELDRLIYQCINEFGAEERQRLALERIFDLLIERTNFGKNVIKCSVCGGARLSVARVEDAPADYYQCAVCYAEEMVMDGQEVQ